RMIDTITEAPLPGSLTEVEYFGTLPHDLKQHRIDNGQADLVVPGTVRLRAEAPGYVPLVLSPVLDNEGLINLITHLNDEDLLNWKTYETIREQLSDVKLAFKMRKAAAR